MFTALINIDPIFSVLFEYLNYIEKRVFRQAYSKERSFEGLYKEVPFSDVILSRLSKLIPEPEIFLEQLGKAHGLISGSFILQCLYGVEWESDIDVYSMGEAWNKRHSNLDRMKFLGYLHHNYLRRNPAPNNCRGDYVQQYVVNNVYHLDASRINKDSSIMINLTDEKKEKLMKMWNHGHKGIINGLELLDENETPMKYVIFDGDNKDNKRNFTTSILNYINKIFDFDFCKVAYDPATKELHILNFDAVLRMECVIDRKFIIEIRNTRAGTKLKDDDIKRLTDILNKRIVKYASRGFTLTEKS